VTADAAIAERLDRIERQLAALLSAARPAAPPDALRVTLRQAAAALGCSVQTVYRHVWRGLLLKLPKPAGAGKTARTYFDPANVRALAESEDAARDWVAARKYVPHGKRR
jgi:predicted DNA-binding transcriptional regulator AlpA